jgi:hypothetical protein
MMNARTHQFLIVIFLIKLLFPVVIFAKTVNGEKGLIPDVAGHDLSMLPQFQKKSKKKFKLVKDKNGAYKVTWGVLAELDLKTMKVSDNLKKIVGKTVSINGFMIPLDYQARQVREFLLVPYMPTCAHIPPPPANMILKVKINHKKGVKPLFFPINVRGKLSVGELKISKDPYALSGVFNLSKAYIGEAKFE